MNTIVLLDKVPDCQDCTVFGSTRSDEDEVAAECDEADLPVASVPQISARAAAQRELAKRSTHMSFRLRATLGNSLPGVVTL